jgi:succinate dehydrogenase / fumarate reductase membrane anchor subunit
MEHWKLQRISAIIMIPIVILSLLYIINISSIPYGQLIEDLSSISGFILSVAFIGFILFHSSMGLEVIIEDYIHSQGLQNNVISISKLLHIISFFLTVLILASI